MDLVVRCEFRVVRKIWRHFANFAIETFFCQLFGYEEGQKNLWHGINLIVYECIANGVGQMLEGT